LANGLSGLKFAARVSLDRETDFTDHDRRAFSGDK